MSLKRFTIILFHSKLLIRLSFFYICFSSLVIFNQPCDELLDKSQDRIDFLQDFLLSQPQILHINNMEIAAIVLPEYILHNEFRDNLEIVYIKMLYSMRLEKYAEISFGPFQMDINFIFKTLVDAHENNIIKYKIKSKLDIVENLDKYTTLERQWEVLCLFVQNQTQLTSQDNWQKLISNLYNSGSIINKSRYYKKITCSRKSYYEWSQIFKKQFIL